MKDTKIEVPAVAWWVLAALIIPVLQVWLQQAFPNSPYAWVPLAVAVLGAVLKWISWVMAQNSQPLPDEGDDALPAPAQMGKTPDQHTLEADLLDYRRPSFDWWEFLVGIKRQ
jgi:hypothetical protein